MYCHEHKATFDAHECPLCVEQEQAMGIYPREKQKRCLRCGDVLIPCGVDGDWSECSCDHEYVEKPWLWTQDMPEGRTDEQTSDDSLLY